MRMLNMRRMIPALLLALVLGLSVTAAAASGAAKLAAPFPAGSGEAVLAARIAEELGLDYAPEDEKASLSNESRAEAANRMLTEPGTLLCDTQSALMAGLQGYTAEDLRTAMVPVCRVARCPLYLVMDPGKAEEKGITDGDSFLAYLAENEYDGSLLLARHVEADPTDRAAVRLSDQLPLLTELFWPEEIPDALQSGEAALAVFTEAELNAAGGDLLILFTLGGERTGTRPDLPALPEAGIEACPEPALFLMAGTGEDEAFLEAAAEKICSADLAAECLAAGFIFDPLSGGPLADEISAIFADYKEYMTAEGLYFYESD